MGEPFKNQISCELITQIGSVLQSIWGEFDREGFVYLASENLENQELKQRCFSIVEALEVYLPDDYLKAANILEKALHPETDEGGFKGKTVTHEGLQGWAIMAVQEYVGKRGLNHLGVSLNLLKEMTKRLTAEFGIRYFLQEYQLETLKTMQVWVMDPNEHIRRLVSEGTRPRLPWGMQLKRFVNDPSPLIPLLEVLKDDPSEYVRRSVANNLNDISKDHPEIVCMVAEAWMRDASQNRKRLIRHALRTLIKKGHTRALAILGFEEAKLKKTILQIETKVLELGDALEFTVELQSAIKQLQPILMDYALHYRKANGTLSPKVFKWKQFHLAAGKPVVLRKRQKIVDVTVRKHYPGIHEVELLVNGSSVAKAAFELVMPS